MKLSGLLRVCLLWGILMTTSAWYKVEAQIFGANLAATKGFSAFNLSRGAYQWVDYDRDGQMELIFTGDRNNGTSVRSSLILKKDASGVYQDVTATAVPGGLTATHVGKIKAADYNNDGWIDFVLTGHNGSAYVTEIYKNNGPTYAAEDVSESNPVTFTKQTAAQLGVTLVPAAWGDVDWGDYDRDGYIDLVVTGQTTVVAPWSGNRTYSTYTNLYHNNHNGGFEATTYANQTGTAGNGFLGFMRFIDYDNDGWLDLVGNWGVGRGLGFARNASGIMGLTSSLSINGYLTSLATGRSHQADIGDFNNDGCPDIAWFACESSSKSDNNIFKNLKSPLYGYYFTKANSGIGTSSNTFIAAASANTTQQWPYPTNSCGNNGGYAYPPSSLNFCDANCDGAQDFVSTGVDPANATLVFNVLGNTGTSTANAYKYKMRDTTSTWLTSGSYGGVVGGTAQFVDLTGDNKPDLFVSGSTGTASSTTGTGATYFLQNILPTTITNSAPAAPKNLVATQKANSYDVSLTWDQATDDHTPAKAITYEIRVGKTSGGCDVATGFADISTGKMLVARAGMISDTMRIKGNLLTNLSPGVYYWSVHAVDNSFIGGAWAEETKFTISTITVSTPSTQITSITSSVGTTTANLSWTVGDGARSIVFMKKSTTTTDVPTVAVGGIYPSTTVFGTSSAKMGETDWYCVYNGIGNSAVISNLRPYTSYQVVAYSFNQGGLITKYLTTTSTTNNVLTTTSAYGVPNTSPISYTLSDNDSTKINVKYSGTPTYSLALFVKRFSSVAEAATELPAPVDYVTYPMINDVASSPTVFYVPDGGHPAPAAQIGSTGWYSVANMNTGNYTETKVINGTTYYTSGGAWNSFPIKGLHAGAVYKFALVSYSQGYEGYERYYPAGAVTNVYRHHYPYPTVLPNDTAIVTSNTEAFLQCTASSVTITGQTAATGRCAFVAEGEVTSMPVLEDFKQYNVGDADNSGLYKCIYNGSATVDMNVRFDITPNKYFSVQVVDYNGEGNLASYQTITGRTPQKIISLKAPEDMSTIVKSSLVVQDTYADMDITLPSTAVGTVNHLVLVTTDESQAAVTPLLTDDKVYSIGATVTSSQSWFVVANSSSTTLHLTGLTQNTKYYVFVADYVISYVTATPTVKYVVKTQNNTTSFTTLKTQNLSFSNANEYVFDYLSAYPTISYKAEGSVTFVSSDPSIVTVGSDGALSVSKAGSVTITINAAATSQYAKASTSTVMIVNKISQTIKGIDAHYTQNVASGNLYLSPYSTSGLLNFTFSLVNAVSTNTAVLATASIEDGTGYGIIAPQANGSGDVIVTVTQPGTDSYYSAAVSTTVSIVDRVVPTFSGVTSTLAVYYDAANVSIGATVSNNATISYSSSNPDVASVTSNGVIDFLTAGKTTITLSTVGDLDYKAVSTTIAITVSKYAQSISVSPTAITVSYGAASQSFSVSGTITPYTVVSSNTNVAVVDVANSVINFVGAGSSTITVQAEETTNNYGATASCLVTVNKLDNAISNLSSTSTLTYHTTADNFTLAPSALGTGTFTYTSSNETAVSVDASGVVDIKLIGKSVIMATNSGDDKYKAVSASFTIVVIGIPQTITYTPATITTAIGGSSVALSANSNCSTSLLNFQTSYSKVATVGTVSNATLGTASTEIIPGSLAGETSIMVTSTDISNIYADTTVYVPVVLTKGNAVITWATPAAIPYGTALGANQLNASTVEASRMVYKPTSGTVLGAPGTYTLSVTTSATTNYYAGSASVQIQVVQATPTITWAAPASIVYGDLLSAAQLNATTNSPALPVYSPSFNAQLSAGTRTLSVYYEGDANYVSVTKTVSITVAAKPVVVSVSPVTAIWDGTAKVASYTLSIPVPYKVTYNGSLETPVAAGSYLVEVSVDDSNYSGYASSTLTISPLTPVITWNPGAIKYGEEVGVKYPASVTGGGKATYTSTSALPVGTYDVTVTFEGTNYAATSTTRSITIEKAEGTLVADFTLPSVMKIGSSQTLTYSGPYSSVQFASTNSAVASVSANVINAVAQGTASVVATFTGNSNYLDYTVTKTIDVTNLNVNSTFAVSSIGSKVYGDLPFEVVVNKGLSTGNVSITVASGNVTLSGTNTLSITAPGDVTLNITQASADGYASVTKVVTFTVSKSSARQITWEPVAIDYGTSFAGSQNASISIESSDVQYSVASSTILNAGTYNVTVSYAATSLYAAVSKTVSFVVNKISPVITWSNPADISYGVLLSATQLNAVESKGTPAIASYSPGIGALLDGGDHQITVSYAATTNFKAASSTVSIKVLPLSYPIVWNTPADIDAITPLSAAQLNAKINGVTISSGYSPVPGTILSVGEHVLSVDVPASNNYAAAAAAVTINVKKAVPTILWNITSSLDYGELLSANELGAVCTSGAEPTYNYSIGDLLNAGTYTLTVTYPAIGVYEAASASVSLTVNKILPTNLISWSKPASITYGTLLSVTQLNATSLTAGSITYKIKGGQSVDVGTKLDAGSYVLVATLDPSDANYSTVTLEYAFTVSKATQTITWGTPAAITYGVALSTTQLNATTTSTSLGVYTVATGTILSAGTYTITVSFDADNNYQAASTTRTLVVNRQPVTVTLTNVSFVYDGTSKAATYTVNAPATCTVTYNNSTTLPVTAGVYTVVVTAAANYTGSASATLTITKATPSITWNPTNITYGTEVGVVSPATVVGGGSVTYTLTSAIDAGSNKSVTVYVAASTNYAATSKTVSITIDQADGLAKGVFAFSLPATQVLISKSLALSATNAGSATVTFTTSNSSIASISGTLVVGQSIGTVDVIATFTGSVNYKDCSITHSLDVKSLLTNDAFAIQSIGTKTYGDVFPVTYTAGDNTTGDVSFQVSGPASISGTNTITITGIGTVTIVASQAKYGDYAAASRTISFATVQKSAVITFSDLAKVYNGSAQSATISVTDNIALTVTYNGSATAPANAGSYIIAVTSANANYSGSATSTLVIAPKAITPIITDLSKVYSTSGQSVTVTALDGTTAVSTTVTYNGAATLPINAGEYAVSAVISDNNYSGSAAASLTISPKPVSVVISETSKTYTGLSQAVTVTSEGVATTVKYAGSSVAPTTVGSYAVTAVVSNSNYSGSAAATLTIAPKEATITFSNLSKVYNGSAQAASITITDGITYVAKYDGSTTTPTNAGVYGLTVAISNTNYTVVGASAASFTITKKDGTVSFVSLSKVYTGASQAVAITFNGSTTITGATVTILYNGSSIAPLKVGTYNVTATVVSANYAGSSSASYTITRATGRVITWAPTAITYGTKFEGSKTATIDLESTSSTYSVADGTVLNAGSQAVVVTFAASDNYVAVSKSVTLVVNKATLVVKANNVTVQKGKTPEYSYKIEGFVNGDDSNVVTNLSTISLTADTSSLTDGDSTDIVVDASSLKATNYSFKTQNGKLYIIHNVKVSEASSISLNVYPNPVANGLINIVVPSANGAVMTITSNTGAVIVSKKLESETTQFDVNDLKVGTYFIRVVTAEGVAVKQIVKL